MYQVIMLLTRLFVSLAFMSLVKNISCELCGSCFCEDNVGICFLNGCSSELVRSPQIEIIQIYGHLCQNHITTLKDIFYHNTIVEMMEDKCPADMRNCRDNAHSTPSTTTKKYPVPPGGEIEEDDDDDREEEEEEEETTSTSTVAISTVSITPTTIPATTPAVSTTPITIPGTTPAVQISATSPAARRTVQVTPHVPLLHFTLLPIVTTTSSVKFEENIPNDELDEEDLANRNMEDTTHPHVITSKVGEKDDTKGDEKGVTSKEEDYALDYFLEKVFNITKPYEDQYSGLTPCPSEIPVRERDETNWKVYFFVLIMISGLLVAALLICICKMFMRRWRWNIHRQRTREMELGGVPERERPIFNPTHILDLEL